jgi:hypothetical protein
VLAKQAFYSLSHVLRALCLQCRHFTIWAIPLVHFALVIFGDGVLQTICLGWPWTAILPILASQVARITGNEPLVPDLPEIF